LPDRHPVLRRHDELMGDRPNDRLNAIFELHLLNRISLDRS